MKSQNVVSEFLFPECSFYVSGPVKIEEISFSDSYEVFSIECLENIVHSQVRSTSEFANIFNT